MSSEQGDMSFMSEVAELVSSDATATQSIESWPVNSNDSSYGPEQHIESGKSTVTTTTLGTADNEVKKSRKRGRDDNNDGIYLLAMAAQHDHLNPLDQVVNDVLSDAESSTRSP